MALLAIVGLELLVVELDWNDVLFIMGFRVLMMGFREVAMVFIGGGGGMRGRIDGGGMDSEDIEESDDGKRDVIELYCK